MTASTTAYDVFVSYARSDDPGAIRDLRERLKRAGIKAWFDRDDMPNRGTTFSQEIRRAIEASSRVILIVGPGALASDYVTQEWQHADDIGLPVVPVLWRSGASELPTPLLGYHAVEARSPRTPDEWCGEIIRIVRQPVTRLGTCFHVPTQPSRLLRRDDLLERVSRALLPALQRPTDAGRTPRTALLHGISGVGKSIVALTFARSLRTRRTFPDGIVWVPCSPDFHSLAAARSILQEIAPGTRLPEIHEQVTDALAEGIGPREVLLIFDDVEQPEDVEPLIAALGPGSRALITAADPALATPLGAQSFAVDLLADGPARDLLRNWVGTSLPPPTKAILAACDGLPFAIVTVGAMVVNGTPWELIAEALDQDRLDLLEAQSSTSFPHRSIIGVLTASYDALIREDPVAGNCYLELAAFRPGALLNGEVLVRLWSRPRGIARLDAGFVRATLERRLPLLWQNERQYRLHRLHETYIRLRCPDQAELEAALVQTYRNEKNSGRWSDLPDDAYVFENLIYHLVSTGARTDVVDAVDTGWVERQLLRRGDYLQAQQDLRVALVAMSTSPLDYPAFSAIAALSGQVAAKVRDAPAPLIVACAEIGYLDVALGWIMGKPDPFERVILLGDVARILSRAGERRLLERVVRTAIATIPLLVGDVGSGLEADAERLYALNTFVQFPSGPAYTPSPQTVALAQAPLDAVVQLAPLAREVDCLPTLAATKNDFWGVYEDLIPLVASTALAEEGHVELAAELLDLCPRRLDDDEISEANQYRRAVAEAALHRFAEARSQAAAIRPQSTYRSSACRAVSRYLARAGRLAEALALVDQIDPDSETFVIAVDDLCEDAIASDRTDDCLVLAERAAALGWTWFSPLLLAAAGQVGPARQLAEDSTPDQFENDFPYIARLAEILLSEGDRGASSEVVHQLISRLKERVGEMWFQIHWMSPAYQQISEWLLTALIKLGEPTPYLEGMVYAAEVEAGGLPRFKIRLILALVSADRFTKAVNLANSAALEASRSGGLAVALAAAGPEVPSQDLERACDLLTASLGDEPASPSMGVFVGAAVKNSLTLGVAGIDQLVAVLRKQGSPGGGIAEYALHLAITGETALARRLISDELIGDRSSAPSNLRRAMMLHAVAARRSEDSSELTETVELFQDVTVAAAGLDLVFATVQLLVCHRGPARAAEDINRIPGGEAGRFVNEILENHQAGHALSTSRQLIKAAEAVRAVAASAMVLSAVRANDSAAAETWIGTVDVLVEGFFLQGQQEILMAVSQYVGAARVAIGRAVDPPFAAQIADVAWLLWDNGHRKAAVDYALRKLDEPPLVTDGPSVQSADEALAKLRTTATMNSRLAALLLTDAATSHDLAAAESFLELVEHDNHERATTDWLEIASCVIVARHQLAALRSVGPDWWEIALRSAAHLAPSGTVLRFRRVGEAVSTLPTEVSDAIWTAWIRDAAVSGIEEALAVMAQLTMWIPAERIATLTVDHGGRLISKPRAGSKQEYGRAAT